MTTFQDFQRSRRPATDVRDDLLIESETPVAGYHYCDYYFYIAKNPDGTYYTIAENAEVTHADLGTVERWLWDVFAMQELSAQ